MRAKKSLGQNFLHDASIVDNILASIDPRPGETILEIGPGKGALTHRLAQSGARVLAVELDDRLIPLLEEEYIDFDDVQILHANILRIHVGEVMKQFQGKVASYRAVGNLPYYITSAIIRMFLEIEYVPKEMFFMVQKEVGERICAKPGDMSVLSVSVQYYAEPEILFDVPKESFDPVPKVESAFIRVVLHDKQARDKAGDKKFFRLVKIGFSSRRKTLANNLSNGLHKPRIEIEEVIKSIGLDKSVRAQELSVDKWGQLVDKLS